MCRACCISASHPSHNTRMTCPFAGGEPEPWRGLKLSYFSNKEHGAPLSNQIPFICWSDNDNEADAGQMRVEVVLPKPPAGLFLAHPYLTVFKTPQSGSPIPLPHASSLICKRATHPPA